MKYRLLADEPLREVIRHLSPDLKKKVKQALELIMARPQTGKELKMELQGLRSYRIGRFRIIYRVGGSDIQLIAIGPRKTIYQRVIAETKRSN